MTDRILVQRLLAWAFLPVLMLGIASVWFARSHALYVGTAAVAAEMSQSEFEGRVRNYLLEHPQVILDAISRLDAKQGEQEAADAKAALQDSDSPVGGNPKGDVTLVEFFDYNCPFCRAMSPVMMQAETADPQLRIIYKELPILGPNSLFAAKAALAANKQGKYVAFHRALYQLRGHVEEAQVLETARTIDLDVSRLKADMEDKAIAGILEKNVELARTLHITGTPGFVAGDQVTTGATDLKALQAFIGRARSSHQEAK
jgi:protein-disulfide isomerase